MQEVVLSLGSNMGYRELALSKAISMIHEEIGEIVKKSAVYETPSWGFDSSPFLNQVLVLRTVLSPFALLKKTEEIERRLGRSDKTKTINSEVIYSDRTIDIDILLYGDITLTTDELTIPHPLMHKREFIMTPLKELNINFKIENE